MMKAKKSLGQHFLTSKKALEEMILAGEVAKKDLVVEIGPGKGALTSLLLENSGTVIAIEKDDELYKYLNELFKKEILSNKLKIFHADILETNIKELVQSNSYKLVANIPYNITGAIIKKFLSSEAQPQTMALLVQKEVADRIVSRDGKESILSLSVKSYGLPKCFSTVRAGSFVPAPKVDSAVLQVRDISKVFFSSFSEEFFFNMIHAGFRSKRKKVSSNLSQIFGKEKVEEVFEELEIDTNTRAEDIPIETWGKIANLLKK